VKELAEFLEEYPIHWTPLRREKVIGHAEDGRISMNSCYNWTPEQALKIYLHELAHASLQRAGLDARHDARFAGVVNGLHRKFGLPPAGVGVDGYNIHQNRYEETGHTMIHWENRVAQKGLVVALAEEVWTLYRLTIVYTLFTLIIAAGVLLCIVTWPAPAEIFSARSWLRLPLGLGAGALFCWIALKE
jgi:hypothetical protein